jgi:hypothetical protein
MNRTSAVDTTMKYRHQPRTSKGKVTIAKGFQLWREVVCHLSNFYGMDITATVSWSGELGHLVVSRLDVRQPDGGEPITAESLRQIAVGAIVRQSISASVDSGLTPGGPHPYMDTWAAGLITVRQAEQCKAAGPVPATLEWVALLYRAALAIGDAPTKSVRVMFGISQSTAGAWVAAARKQGYLGESEGPGKAGG